MQSLILVIGFFSSLSTIYFGYYAYMLFTTTKLQGVREAILKEAYLPSGLLTAFLIIASTLYFANLFLFFITIKDRFRPLYPLLLLFSSLSFPLMGLCFFGRDGILYWVANFIVLFIWFKDSLPDHLMHNIRRRGTFLIFVLVGVFIYITISRFGSSSKNFFVSVFSYMGQQIQNFSDAFNIKISSYNLLPGFERLFIKIGLMSEARFEKMMELRKSIAGQEYNVFGFFVKDFIWSIGKLQTLIFSIIVFLFARYIKKNIGRRARVEDIILLFALFQVPMNGVFYYRQSISFMDVGLSIVVFICLVFKVKIRLQVKAEPS